MDKVRERFTAAWVVIATALITGVLSGCASNVPRATAVASGVTQVDLGSVAVTMLTDGAGSRALDANFVRNVPLADVQAALAGSGLPTDRVEVPYNPLVVDIGSQRVLFDTGSGEFGAAGSGKLLENMAKAGIDPKSVTAVVISHFHGDHINGLRNKAGSVMFPNAKIYVPAPEWNWWMDDARLAATPEAQRGGLNTARRVFSPLAATVVRFAPGAEILPGVRSIAAYGHTPGHTAFMIDGGSRKLLYWADTTNVSVFVRNPDWAVLFDMDAETAKATRRRIADLAIRENALVAGYHLPGAGIGTLATRGQGYEFHAVAVNLFVAADNTPGCPAMTETRRAVIVSKADMMRYHDPERIQAYCRSCEKYGLYWSCPPFAEQPMAQLGDWTHAVLVTQKTPVDAGSTKEDLIEHFLVSRQILCDNLRQCETGGAIAVVAGHCDGCSVCTRSRGIACCVPSRLRYSLEALGFDVTGLAEGLAGQKMHWPVHGMPNYLLMVGALLCPCRDVAVALGT